MTATSKSSSLSFPQHLTELDRRCRQSKCYGLKEQSRKGQPGRLKMTKRIKPPKRVLRADGHPELGCELLLDEMGFERGRGGSQVG